MNSISKTSGIYALVLQLDHKQLIAFNRRGSEHVFDPGWYVYVGSAHGPGGLHSRVARHQRRAENGKRMHWNVDYFREFASLCEVWYCDSAASEDEHRWAEAVRNTQGAMVPVSKFGAKDCTGGCPAHFFQFSERPWTMAFCSQLQNLGNNQPVFVEFVDDKRDQDTSDSSLIVEYRLGRRFLERRRRAVAECPTGAENWLSMSKGSPSRLLAEAVAQQAGVSFCRMKMAIEVSDAVETVVENCGEPSVAVLFDSKQPQTRKAIMQISRTSDVRQLHRINGVISGQFRSVGPSCDDTVFDTVKFAEVVGRLARARGSIQVLESQLRFSTSNEVILEGRRLARLCMRAASVFDEFVESAIPCSRSLPQELTKEAIMPILRVKSVGSKLIGNGRGALRLTVKNVWDYQEMFHRGILPNEKQREQVHRELQLIADAATAICRITTESM